MSEDHGSQLSGVNRIVFLYIRQQLVQALRVDFDSNVFTLNDVTMIAEWLLRLVVLIMMMEIA